MGIKHRLIAIITIAILVGCEGVNEQSQAHAQAGVSHTTPQTIIIGDPASLPSHDLQKWYEMSKNIEGVHTTTEKNVRYVLIGAGVKPTDGYEFGNPSFTATPTSIKVSVPLFAPNASSVTKQTTTYPHILFCIIDDQRPMVYDGYDLTSVSVSTPPAAVPLSINAVGKMLGRADTASILVAINGESQPQLFYLFGSRDQLEDLQLREGEPIRIVYHTNHPDDQSILRIITHIERVDGGK